MQEQKLQKYASELCHVLAAHLSICNNLGELRDYCDVSYWVVLQQFVSVFQFGLE